MQILHRFHVVGEQARERQVDLLHLLHRQLLDQAGELLQVARHERHRRIGAQLRPFGA